MGSNTPASAFDRTRFLVGLAVALAIAAAGIVAALPGTPPRKHPERIPVRFWHMWTAEWKDVVDRIVVRFNESQDVYEVLPLSVPMNAANSKFLLAVAGGDPPDVMAQWNPVIPKWAESGLLVRLDELMTAPEWEDFQQTAYPAVKKIGIYQGHLYGVTTGLNAFAAYCRVADLRAAGLDPAEFPDTLEGLYAWGDKLNQFDARGNLTRLGFFPLAFYYLVPGFGKGFCDWDTGEVLINTADNLRALEFLVEQRRRLGFDNVIRFQAGLALGIGDAAWPFITGAHAIAMDGQWRVEQIGKYAPRLEYITAPIPPPEGGNKDFGFVNGNFMIIPVGAKCVPGAWEFIKFWSGIENPDRAAEFYTWGGWLPLNPAIAEAPIYRKYVEDHPQFQTFLDLMPSDNMQPLPQVPYQVYLFDRIIRTDDSAMRGTLTPKEALDRLEKEVADEVASRQAVGYQQ
jgi:multiple sugar transport system substrate-binding protein